MVPTIQAPAQVCLVDDDDSVVEVIPEVLFMVSQNEKPTIAAS